MLKSAVFICFIVVIGLSLAIGFYSAFADTNIESFDRWAWSDTIGWIDFYYFQNVNISDSELNGYASSSVGPISLNCDSTPNGNICGASNFKVSNDGSGNLAGWAYNDAIGWISFCGNALGGSTLSGSVWICPASPTYQVLINSETGDFSGWAWNDFAGWISFNCGNTGTCGTASYKNNTSWRPGGPPPPPLLPVASGTLISSTYETSYYSVEGAALNSIMWQGTLGSLSAVKFQVASSNCSNGATNYPLCNSGNWSYLGSLGTASSYYSTAGPDVPVRLRLQDHNNKRYFRYKIFMDIGEGGTSPTVQDVIMNWSP